MYTIIKQTLWQIQQIQPIQLCERTPIRDKASASAIGASFGHQHNRQPGTLQYYIERCSKIEHDLSLQKSENKRLYYELREHQTRIERLENMTRQLKDDKYNVNSELAALRSNEAKADIKGQNAVRYQQERNRYLNELRTLQQKLCDFETQVSEDLKKYRFEPPREVLNVSQAYLVDFRPMTSVLQRVMLLAANYYFATEEKKQDKECIERLQLQINRTAETHRQLIEAQSNIQRESHKVYCMQHEKDTIEQELQHAKLNLTQITERAASLEKSNELIRNQLKDASTRLQNEEHRSNQSKEVTKRLKHEKEDLERRLQEAYDTFQRYKSRTDWELQLARTDTNKQESIHQEIERINENSRKLQAQLEQATCDLNQKSEDNSSLKLCLTQAQYELNQLREEKKQQLKQTTSELSKRTQDISCLEQKNRSLQSDLEKLKKQLTKRATSFEKSNELSRIQLNDTLTKLENEEHRSNQSKEIIKRLKHENKDMERRLQEAEDSFQRYKGRTDQDLQLARTDASKQEVTHHEIERVNENNRKLQQQLEQATFDLNQRSEDSASLNRSLTQAQYDLGQLREEKTKLLRHLQTNVNKQEKTLEDLERSEERCRTLQCQLEQTTSDLSKRAQVNSCLEEKNRSLQSNIEKLKEQLTKRATSFEKSNELSRIQLNDALTKLENEEYRSNQSKGIIERLKHENKDLERRLQEAEDSFQRYKSRTDHDLQLARTDACKQEVTHHEMERVNENNRKLQQRLEQATFDLNQKSEDSASLNRFLTQAQYDLGQLREEKTKLLRQLQTNINKQEKTLQDLEGSEEMCRTLQCHLEKTTSDLSKRAQVNSCLEEKNKSLQSDIGELKERLNATHKLNAVEHTLQKQCREQQIELTKGAR